MQSTFVILDSPTAWDSRHSPAFLQEDRRHSARDLRLFMCFLLFIHPNGDWDAIPNASIVEEKMLPAEIGNSMCPRLSECRSFLRRKMRWGPQYLSSSSMSSCSCAMIVSTCHDQGRKGGWERRSSTSLPPVASSIWGCFAMDKRWPKTRVPKGQHAHIAVTDAWGTQRKSPMPSASSVSELAKAAKLPPKRAKKRLGMKFEWSPAIPTDGSCCCRISAEDVGKTRGAMAFV